MARATMRVNGGRLDGGFDDEASKWAQSNPLFPQAQGQTSGQGAPWSGCTTATLCRPAHHVRGWIAPPSGSTFTAPDGSVGGNRDGNQVGSRAC